jgi:hypothetical protein
MIDSGYWSARSLTIAPDLKYSQSPVTLQRFLLAARSVRQKFEFRCDRSVSQIA